MVGRTTVRAGPLGPASSAQGPSRPGGRLRTKGVRPTVSVGPMSSVPGLQTGLRLGEAIPCLLKLRIYRQCALKILNRGLGLIGGEVH